MVVRDEGKKKEKKVMKGTSRMKVKRMGKKKVRSKGMKRLK